MEILHMYTKWKMQSWFMVWFSLKQIRASTITKPVIPDDLKTDTLNQKWEIIKTTEDFWRWKSGKKLNICMELNRKCSSDTIQEKYRDQKIKDRREINWTAWRAKHLLAKFVVVVWSQPDIDLKEAIDRYEFSMMTDLYFHLKNTRSLLF